MEIAMRKLSFTHVFYVLMLAIYMAGCNPGTPTTAYTIVTPTNNAVVTEVPASFVIRYNAKPTSSDVRLNGVAVKRFFTFGDTEATAAGSDLSGYMLQGKNTFSVDAKVGGPTISFTLDTTGPKVVVMSVSTTEPKEIKGLASDPSGVASLLINGASVPVGTDGFFTAYVSTAGQYNFSATDGLGHASLTQIVPEGKKFNPIIKARIHESVVQTIIPAVTEGIKNADLMPLIAPLNPIINTTWKGLVGETYGMVAKIDQASIGSVVMNSFTISPTNDGALSINIDINDIAAHMDLKILNGLLPALPIKGWFYADRAHFDGTVKVTAQNAKMQVKIPKVNLGLTGVRLDVSGIPSFVEYLINPLLQGVVDAITKVLSAVIPTVIETVLGDELTDMVITTTLTIDATPAEGDEIKMALDTGVQTITTIDHNLVVTLNGGVYALSADEGVAPMLGSEYDAGAVPDPALDEGNIGVVISANLFNQALSVAYKVGLMRFWIMDKHLYFGVTPDDTIGTVGKTRIRLVPTNPAAFRVSGNDTIVSTLELNAFDIFLDKKLATGWAPQFQLNMDTALSIELGVDDKNRLTIGLVGTPKFYVNFVENYTALPLDEAKLTQTINTVLPYIVPALGNAVSTIEVPSFGKIQVRPERLSAVGPNHQHMSISGSILPAP
jgi:hypothetical protein